MININRKYMWLKKNLNLRKLWNKTHNPGILHAGSRSYGITFDLCHSYTHVSKKKKKRSTRVSFKCITTVVVSLWQWLLACWAEEEPTNEKRYRRTELKSTLTSLKKNDSSTYIVHTVSHFQVCTGKGVTCYWRASSSVLALTESTALTSQSGR